MFTQAYLEILLCIERHTIIISYFSHAGAGCSGKIVSFFLLPPLPRCFWSFRKWPTNRSDCTLRSLSRISWSPTCRGMGCSDLGKTYFLINTLYHTISFLHTLYEKMRFLKILFGIYLCNITPVI